MKLFASKKITQRIGVIDPFIAEYIFIYLLILFH